MLFRMHEPHSVPKRYLTFDVVDCFEHDSESVHVVTAFAGLFTVVLRDDMGQF